VQQKIALLELLTGLGLLVGPSLGAFLFNIGGYSAPFFIFAALFLSFVIPSFNWIPQN
jgi:hypothetical protein